MQLSKIFFMIAALGASPTLAVPSTEKYHDSREIRTTPSPRRAPTPLKIETDIEKITSATTMVNSYIDRVSLYGNKATESIISATLSYFQDLISAFQEINQENINIPPSAFSDSDKFTLCTSVWNLIYKEKNTADYIGTVEGIVSKSGFGTKTIDALDSYQDQASKFFRELILRLDVCQGQLNYGLEDLMDTITMTKSRFVKGVKAAKQAATKQASKKQDTKKKGRKNGLWGRDFE